MTQSKVVMRLRKTRTDQAPVRGAQRAAWQAARRRDAAAVRMALAEDAADRRDARAAAAAAMRAKLDDLAQDREELRCEGEKERGTHLVNLIVAVNDLTAAFQTAGEERKRRSMQLCADVASYLTERRGRREDSKAQQAATFHAFRLTLAKSACQARCKDFR